MWTWEHRPIATDITALDGEWEWVRVWRPRRKAVIYNN